jgi:hypothetical protein
MFHIPRPDADASNLTYKTTEKSGQYNQSYEDRRKTKQEIWFILYLS